MSRGGRPPGRFRVGAVPSEPFLSWWIEMRNRLRPLYQRTTSGVNHLTSGQGAFGGSHRRVLSERETLVQQFDTQWFATWCGITKAEYDTLCAYARKQAPSVSVDVVDRVLTATGNTHLMVIWYPPDFFDSSGRWVGHPVCGDD